MPTTHYSTEGIHLFPNRKNKKIAQITRASEGNTCARNLAKGQAKGLTSGSTARAQREHSGSTATAQREHSGSTTGARREHSGSTAGAQREHRTPRTRPARRQYTRTREHSGSTARSTPGAHREHTRSTPGAQREHRDATDPACPSPAQQEKHYQEPPVAYAAGRNM